MTQPIETHLDLDFLTQYREGYSDQEIFGHLAYGVRLKAPTPQQIVLQPHMISAVGRFDAVQKELSRLVGLNWYEICASLPFCPFSAVQQGTAERALEPDRPRRTSNYTAPIPIFGTQWGKRWCPSTKRLHRQTLRGKGQGGMRSV